MQVIEQTVHQTSQYRTRLPEERIVLMQSEIKKAENQNQCFLPVTEQMDLPEAIKWAKNTTTFKPLILENRYSTNRHRYYSVVRHVVDGIKIKPGLGILWELVPNKSLQVTSS